MIRTFAAFLKFCYIACRNVINEDSLKALKAALHRFHQFHTVFSGPVRLDDLAGFALPRQHSLVHYHDNIKKFGSPNGLCSSITESKHIVAVKRPWRCSSRYRALSQILKVNQRLDKLVAVKVDFTSHGMLTGPSLLSSSNEFIGTNHADGNDYNDNRAANGNNNMDNDSGYDANDSDEEVDGGGDDNDSDDETGAVESAEPLMNEVRLAYEKGQSCSLRHILKLYI